MCLHRGCTIGYSVPCSWHNTITWQPRDMLCRCACRQTAHTAHPGHTELRSEHLASDSDKLYSLIVLRVQELGFEGLSELLSWMSQHYWQQTSDERNHLQYLIHMPLQQDYASKCAAVEMNRPTTFNVCTLFSRLSCLSDASGSEVLLST